MEMLGWLGVIAMLIGFVFSILILMGKKKGGIDVGAKWKTPMTAGLLVVGVAGLLMTPFASYIPGLSTFAITAPEPTTTLSTPNGQTDLILYQLVFAYGVQMPAVLIQEHLEFFQKTKTLQTLPAVQLIL